jgi:hypothetical protein
MAANLPPDFVYALGATPPASPRGTLLNPAGIQAFRDRRDTLRQQILNAVIQGAAVVQGAPAIPQPVVGPVPAVIPVAPVVPRCGGLELVNNVQIPWTGGGTNGTATAILTPKSTYAYRSRDLNTALKVEKACTEGLPESRHLPAPGTTDTSAAANSITFAEWLYMLRMALIERGLDSVFRPTIGNQEVFLLEKWGQATKEVIDAHVEWLYQPNQGDAYDHQNLQLSAKFILNSLDTEMLRRTENEIGNALQRAPTGLEVFGAVISLYSVLNDSTERHFTDKLLKLHLADEPGQNVMTFSDKVLQIARQIAGISDNRTRDLHTLVYQTFKGCSNPEFASAVSILIQKCLYQQDPDVRDYERHVTMLRQMYRDLVGLNAWEALKHKKEGHEAQGLKATTQTQDTKLLKAEVKKLRKIINKAGLSSGGTSNTNKQIICHWCGEEGHIKPNCKNLDKPKKYKPEGGGTSNSHTGGGCNSGEFKAKVGPKDGEPTTKTHKGTQYKWCDTCKKWNSGEKAHHTSEHVKGKGAAGTQPTGALAQTYVSGASLTFVAGYAAMLSNTTEETYPIDVDTHYIESGYGHVSILSDAGVHSEYPGAIWCGSCQQYFTDADHQESLLHSTNKRWYEQWLEQMKASEQDDESEEGEDGFVTVVRKQHRKRTSLNSNAGQR